MEFIGNPQWIHCPFIFWRAWKTLMSPCVLPNCPGMHDDTGVYSECLPFFSMGWWFFRTSGDSGMALSAPCFSNMESTWNSSELLTPVCMFPVCTPGHSDLHQVVPSCCFISVMMQPVNSWRRSPFPSADDWIQTACLLSSSVSPVRPTLPTFRPQDQRGEDASPPQHKLSETNTHSSHAPSASASNPRQADWLLREYPYSEGVAKHKQCGSCRDCLRFRGDDSDDLPVSL